MDKEMQLIEIKNYTIKSMEKDQTGHSMDHIIRVVRMAEQIALTEECDLFLVQAGAYLHDVTDEKLVSNEEEAKQSLIDFLQSIKISETDIQQISYIIDHVSYSSGIGREPEILTIEAQIVQDADRLDAIGAMGIGRTFYYGGNKGHEIYDAGNPPIVAQSKEDYRRKSTVINHFYEKLLLLPDKMNTTYAKELAKKRKIIMDDFLKAFYEEWEGR